MEESLVALAVLLATMALFGISQIVIWNLGIGFF
jgi:hypothetical protein